MFYRADLFLQSELHLRIKFKSANKKIPAASRRGILDAFEKSLAKLNSIFAPRGGVLDPKLRNEIQTMRQGWGLFRDRRPDLYGSLLSLDGSD